MKGACCMFTASTKLNNVARELFCELESIVYFFRPLLEYQMTMFMKHFSFASCKKVFLEQKVF